MKPLQILLTCFFLTVPVRADDLAERKKVAIDLVEAIRGQDVNLEAFKKQIRASVIAAAEEQDLGPEQLKEVKKATEETLATLTREKLVAAIAEGYANRLSIDELKAILDFYRSGPGKALKREQSQIDQEGLAAMSLLGKELAKDAGSRFNQRGEKK